MSDKSMSNERQITFARRYRRNQFFDELYGCFAKLARTKGLKKSDIATFLGKDASQVTRWFSEPSNISLDAISDLLLAMNADIQIEVKPYPTADVVGADARGDR